MLEIILSLAGVVISCFSSWRIAKHTAKSEIAKLQTMWAHEKESANDAAFDNMVKAVNRYLKDTSIEAFAAALDSVSLCRARLTGDLADLVDQLDSFIVRGVPDRPALSAKLQELVQHKREADRCKRPA